jgi:hypothetical protein
MAALASDWSRHFFTSPELPSLTFLSVVSELFLWMQNKFGNQILGKMKGQGDMHSVVTFHLAKHLTNAVINTYTLPF